MNQLERVVHAITTYMPSPLKESLKELARGGGASLESLGGLESRFLIKRLPTGNYQFTDEGKRALRVVLREK